MAKFVYRLERPYNQRRLIEVFVRTQDKHYVHGDFPSYYAKLLRVLEGQFGLSFDGNQLTVEQLGIFGLFLGTIDSLLRITTPWSGYLESTLLIRELKELGERGQTIFHYSDEIQRIAIENEALHWKMLDNLFVIIFGERTQVVTSEDLLRVGFDDAEEPQLSDYYDLM